MKYKYLPCDKSEICLPSPDHCNFVPKLIGQQNYACRAIHHLYAMPILLWTATGVSCYLVLESTITLFQASICTFFSCSSNFNFILWYFFAFRHTRPWVLAMAMQPTKQKLNKIALTRTQLLELCYGCKLLIQIQVWTFLKVLILLCIDVIFRKFRVDELC